MKYRILEKGGKYFPQANAGWFGSWKNLVRWWGDAGIGPLPGFNDYRIAIGPNSESGWSRIEHAESIIEDAKNQPTLKSITDYGVSPVFNDGYQREYKKQSA